MKTVVVDPNRVDGSGCVIASASYTGEPTAGETVRMLEMEAGEYWYAIVELIDIVKEGYRRLHLRPLHQSS